MLELILSLSIVDYITPIGNILFRRETGAIVAVAAFFLSLYRFVYLRPELLLDVDVNGYSGRQDGTGYESVLEMYLVNAGNQFAEDVQLTFVLDDFKFDSDVDISENMADDYEISTTMMEVRSGRRLGFIGGGMRHDIFFENTVYEKDVHSLYYGKSIFDSESTYQIKYTVACRTHGLRQGKIILKMTDGEINVISEYPTILRQLKAYFGWGPELKRTQRVRT